MRETELKWGISFDRVGDRGMWSFGIALSHLVDETYLYINIGFYTITIGKFRG